MPRHFAALYSAGNRAKWDSNHRRQIATGFGVITG